jgi:hypothetical protein
MWTSRFQMAEECFAMRERRAFCDRARSDRTVGLWAASQLGLSEGAARVYAESVVAAGVLSADGRGGFDRIAADLSRVMVKVDAIRTQYSAAMAETGPRQIEAAPALYA